MGLPNKNKYYKGKQSKRSKLMKNLWLLRGKKKNVKITFNMPRKVVITRGNPRSSNKRNLSVTQDDSVDKEDNVSNVKKRKNDYAPSEHKEKNPMHSSRLILPVRSTRQTASASISSAQSTNENTENCKEQCPISTREPRTTRQTASASASSSQSTNENIENCKELGPISTIAPGSTRQTVSASVSSSQSTNENKSNCENLVPISTKAPLDHPTSVSLNPNYILSVSIVPYHSECMRNKSQVKKRPNVCATKDSEQNMSEVPEVMDTCKLEEGMRCIICMDTKTYVRYKSLDCGHNFHAICLRSWLKCNNVCPICMPCSSERNDLNIFSDQDICVSHERLPCLICLDTVISPNYETLSCTHSFHGVCIQIWFAVKEVCPVCMGCNPSDSSQDDFNDLRENILCMICKNTEVFYDFEFLLCNHSFHAICLENWFQVSPSCPICTPYDSDSNTSFRLQGRDGDAEQSVICIGTYQMQGRDGNSEQCVICMGTEESNVLEDLSCGHTFHSMCIQTWFQVKKSCPVCIPPVSVNQSSNISTNNDYEELQCMICMGNEGSSEFEAISCDVRNNVWHSFHSTCIKTWFRVNQSCPVCDPDIAIKSPPKVPEEKESEIVRCAICVDTEEYTDIEFLECCHSFHSVCIQNWLKRKNKCPICNTIISVNGALNISQTQALHCS